MAKLFSLWILYVVIWTPSHVLAAPATCQEKVLDTVTVQGKYYGYSTTDHVIVLEVDGLSDYFFIMASEEDAKKAFGDSTDTYVEVTYNVDQIFFEESESCEHFNVFVEGRLLSEKMNTPPKEEQTSPLEISIQDKHSSLGALSVTTRHIKFISITDKLIIKDIVINRGNVKFDKFLTAKDYARGMKSAAAMEKVFKEPIVPAELAYGEDLEVTVPSGSNILEIRVVTNHGEWTFTYN